MAVLQCVVMKSLARDELFAAIREAAMATYGSRLIALAIFGSIQSLGATRAALLEISYPLFVAVFAVLLFRERLDPGVLAGGGFIALGSAIIVLTSR